MSKKDKNKCRQIQTVRKTIKPKHFKRSVETDIVILVMYEPFKLTECGVRLVKMAPLNYDYRKIGEYVIMGGTGRVFLRNRKKDKNKCSQIQTVRKTLKPKYFEQSVANDIVILVMYEPFKLTKCGVRLVKMAR